MISFLISSKPIKQQGDLSGLAAQGAQIRNLLFGMPAIAHQAKAIEGHFHMCRSKGNISRTSPIRVNGRNWPMTEVLAGCIKQGQQFSIAVCRRHRRIAIPETDRRFGAATRLKLTELP